MRLTVDLGKSKSQKGLGKQRKRKGINMVVDNPLDFSLGVLYSEFPWVRR